MAAVLQEEVKRQEVEAANSSWVLAVVLIGIEPA